MARPLSISSSGGSLTTTYKKFGSASLTGLAIVSSAELNVGFGDYTIEFWYRTTYDNTSYPPGIELFNNEGGSSSISNPGMYLRLETVTGGDSQYFRHKVRFPATDGSSTAVDITGLYNPGSVIVTGGTWAHYGLMRQSGTTYFLVDGRAIELSTDSYFVNYTATWNIGDANANVDEWRISNSARYTPSGTPGNTTYTLATERFIDDANTLVLCHFDGTDGSTTFVDTVNYTHSASANLSALATQLTVQNPSPSMVYLENDIFTWDDTDTWDTIYDGDNKWAVWETQTRAAATLTARGGISNVSGAATLSTTATLQADARLSDVRGTATLAATASLETAGRILKLASLDMTSLGDMTANGRVDIKASANLTSTAGFYAKGGFLIGIDDPFEYTWDTVPEDQWSGFLTDVWDPRGWFAFDNVTLTASAGRTIDASATLEAFATQLTAARTSNVRGSADLTAAFNLTSGSDNSKSGSAELVAAFDLVSQSSVDHPGSATLQSAFTVDANSRILKLANLDITTLGDMTVSAAVTHNAGSLLDSQFTLDAQSLNLKRVSADLAAEFTSIITATLIPNVELDEVAFVATLNADAVMVYGGSARLEAFAAELTAGQRVVGGSANLSAEFSTVISPTMVYSAGAQLEAFATELVAGRISTTRGTATLAATFAAEFAGELKLLDSQFIYKVLHENRTFEIESEIRKYDVLPENRLFGIDPESRLYQVLPENRTVDVGYFMQ